MRIWWRDASFPVELGFCPSATWKISCTHMHKHPWWPASEFFAVNHFSFSQTLTTRSEMLFLALNVLLWNAAVRPFSSYFLHPAGVVSRSESIFLFTPSALGRGDVQLSRLVFKLGIQKDVLLAALLHGSAGITVSSSQLGLCGRLCKLEISSS